MDGEHEPIIADSIPREAPLPEGIPLARPITLPGPPPSTAAVHDIFVAGSTGKEAWADIGAAAVILIAFEIWAGIVLAVLTGAFDLPGDEFPPELEQGLLAPIIALRSAVVIVVLVLILRRRGQSARSVGVARDGLGLDSLIGAGAMLTCYGLITIFQMALWGLWPGLAEQMTDNTERLLDLIPRLHPLGYVGIALMIGLHEELLFRGFLMTRLRRGTGSWTLAVLLSTAVFTSLHVFDQEAIALVPITILSLVLSLVTIWRRSIMPAIVGHFLFDLAAFLYLSTMVVE